MRKFGLFLLLAAGLRAAAPDPAASAGIALFRAGKYAEAAAALEKAQAADPKNAETCYYLGMALNHAGGERALEDAMPWLERACALAPDNAGYLGDFAGNCLELADMKQSFFLAVRGRDAMERALAMNPDDLEAREGLMRFYAEAPWPLGSSRRAWREAAEIVRRSPSYGLRSYLTLARSFLRRHDTGSAREAYALVLKLDPGNSSAVAAMAKLEPPGS